MVCRSRQFLRWPKSSKDNLGLFVSATFLFDRGYTCILFLRRVITQASKGGDFLYKCCDTAGISPSQTKPPKGGKKKLSQIPTVNGRKIQHWLLAGVVDLRRGALPPSLSPVACVEERISLSLSLSSQRQVTDTLTHAPAPAPATRGGGGGVSPRWFFLRRRGEGTRASAHRTIIQCNPQ